MLQIHETMRYPERDAFQYTEINLNFLQINYIELFALRAPRWKHLQVQACLISLTLTVHTVFVLIPG